LIKKQISKATEDGIRSGLIQLDAQLVEIRDRIKRTEGDDETSKTQVIKDVFSRKAAEGEEKAEANKPKGTFKVCLSPLAFVVVFPSQGLRKGIVRLQLVNKRDSKIIGYSSPDSIVEKQGASLEKAISGEGWKSPAFDIVA
jgi:hypothetical protein